MCQAFVTTDTSERPVYDTNCETECLYQPDQELCHLSMSVYFKHVYFKHVCFESRLLVVTSQKLYGQSSSLYFDPIEYEDGDDWNLLDTIEIESDYQNDQAGFSWN